MTTPSGEGSLTTNVFGSLRFRIVSLNLLAFGFVLAAVAGAILLVIERNAYRDLEETLYHRAEALQRSWDPSDSPRNRGLNYFSQIRGDDGRIEYQSRSLSGSNLPWSPAAQDARHHSDGVLETIDGEAARALLHGEGELRMLTICASNAGGPMQYIQVACDTRPIHAIHGRLRGLAIGGIFGGLLVAGLSAWFLTQYSLSPLGRMARESRDLSAANLNRRLVVPPTADEVAELARVINQMLDRIQAAFQAEERFIADVSHELKTPLSVLLGEAQVLNQQPRSIEEYQKFAASAQDEMRRLADVVNSLLTLARAHAGFPLHSVSVVSPNDVIVEATRICEPLAKQRRVRLVPTLADPDASDREALVAGDPDLLRTMLTNLIQNAIKYTPASEAVEIAAAQTTDAVTVAVRDRGPGVPPDRIEHIFERFQRVPDAEEAQRKKPRGTGLGLAIAKAVADLHRGGIRARNREGGGCEFVVSLPLASEPTSARRPSIGPATGQRQ